MNNCPRCNLINPPDAVRCDCGYDFLSRKGGLEQRKFLFKPLVVRNVGIALFILSFLAPGSWRAWQSGGDFSVCAGFTAFVQTPFLAIHIFRIDEKSWYRILLCVTLLISWAANFTIFFRLPKKAALAAIAAPWCVFICWFSMTVEFIPFYPWALGIAFIHLSRMLRPKN
jgi:hypothetical protein